MTNNWTDIGNSTLVIAWGANPSENHPACMAHIGRARNGGYTFVDASGNSHTSAKIGAQLWVVDPRKTRTACLADRHIRIRPGTDIALFNGVVSYVIENLENATDFTANQRTNLVNWLNRSSDSHTWRNDAGATTAVAGRSKYTDARLLINAAGDDYERALYADASGNTITNLTVVGSAYNAVGENTVYNKLRAHVAHYTPAKTAEICGCTSQDVIDLAKKIVDNSRCSSFNAGTPTTIVGDPTSADYRSTTLLYAMGITQHTCGSQNVKSFAVLQTLLGNAGRAGGGINALRGIHNVQGSTDMGLLYGNIPAYSGNPAVQPYEDANAFGKYVDALWGNRVSGGVRAKVSAASGAGETIMYVAKTAMDYSGNLTVAYIDPAAASATLSVDVSGNVIRVNLATDVSGNRTSTATQVAVAVNASTAAKALVGAAVTAGGATVVAAMGATALIGGVNATYAAAYTGTGLQQIGFRNMTKRFFSNNTYAPATNSDVDKLYSLWPKQNGTNHIQMFRNMADTGTVTNQDYSFTDASGNASNTARIIPAGTAVKKGIKAGTLTVTDASGNPYAQGTDFRVNYPTGGITRVTTGTIPASATVKVSYDYGIRALVCWGQNPAVTEPNQSAVRAGLYNLDLLVVTDMFANETARCDRKPGSVTFLLPACSHVEKEGSATNSGRVLQWRYAAKAPRGNSRPDLFWLFKMIEALDAANAFTHVSAVWATLGGTPPSGSVFSNVATQYGFVEANWDPASPATAMLADATVAENIYAEMCSLGANGGTIWIYVGAYDAGNTNLRPAGYPNVWGATGTGVPNRAKSRDNSDFWGALTYNRWGWAWLVNRRVLYNNGDVHRFGTTTAADEADGYQGPDKCARLYVSTNAGLIDYADGNYRTIHRLSDVPKTPGGANPAVHVLPGRFPAHTEPYESPRDDFATTYGYNSSGTAGNLLLSGTPRGTVANYPLVLTTIRCVEHFQGGPITRNNPANHEAEPEPWIEINSVDALNLGITDGSWVKIVTARTDGNSDDTINKDASGNTRPATQNAAFGSGFKARVGVGAQSNQRVGQGVVAIPWHWGERGLSTGSRANDITIDAMDANTTIPEYKACLCRLVKL